MSRWYTRSNAGSMAVATHEHAIDRTDGAGGNPVGAHEQIREATNTVPGERCRAPLVHVSRRLGGINERAGIRDGRSGVRLGEGFGDLVQLGAKARNVL